MAKGQSLQDPFLNALRKERVPVSIYLVNGIKLQGQIDSQLWSHLVLNRPSGLGGQQPLQDRPELALQLGCFECLERKVGPLMKADQPHR